jgi:hypothetical protein
VELAIGIQVEQLPEGIYLATSDVLRHASDGTIT